MKRYRELLARADAASEASEAQTNPTMALLHELTTALSEADALLHNTETTIGHLRKRRNYYRSHYYRAVALFKVHQEAYGTAEDHASDFSVFDPQASEAAQIWRVQRDVVIAEADGGDLEKRLEENYLGEEPNKEVPNKEVIATLQWLAKELRAYCG